MKKVSIYLLIATLASGCHAQNILSEISFNIEQLSFIKWNSPAGISYQQEPGANLGATSFEIINDNQIAFLCNSNNEIAIVNIEEGQVIKRIPVAFSPRDFSYDKHKFYVLSEFKVVVYDEGGAEINSFPFNRKCVGVERIARYDNSTYLILPSGNTLLVESNGQSVESEEIEGCITNLGYRVLITPIVNNRYNVILFYPSGEKIENTYQSDLKVAGVFTIGVIANRIVLDVQSYLSENPIKVERKIVSIELNKEEMGNIISETKLPDVYYVLSNKDISLSIYGTLFHMVTAPEGIFIYSLIESKYGNKYPKFLIDKSYHYNEHLLRMDEK